MFRLDDMRLFAAVAAAGSITGAANELGLAKQTLSRRLVELERGLSVQLARRTTRSFTLTDVGRAYAQRCAAVVRLADEANAAVSSQVAAVAGTLRVTADHTFGEAFLPGLVTAYLEKHSDVQVQVLLTSRRLDLIDEGFDIAFRVGPPPDVTYLAATRLGAARLLTVAAPSYLRRRAAPRRLEDLHEHVCLSAAPTLRHTEWPFLIDGDLRARRIAARLHVNNAALTLEVALSGAGIAQLPEFLVLDDLETGRLVQLLKPYTPELGGVHVVYPHSALLAPKVTEFVAAAKQRFASGAR